VKRLKTWWHGTKALTGAKFRWQRALHRLRFEKIRDRLAALEEYTAYADRRMNGLAEFRPTERIQALEADVNRLWDRLCAFDSKPRDLGEPIPDSYEKRRPFPGVHRV
jgi:hypothetical protein